MLSWIDKHLRIIFILPCIVFVVTLIAIPLFYNIGISFTTWSMSSVEAPRFVGFQNYMEVFSDERFWNACLRTVIFVVSALGFETFFGVLFAIMLNRAFMGKKIAQTLFILPVVATPVAVGMVWMLMYEPTIGFANVLLKSLSIPPQQFLATTSLQSLMSLVLVDVWEWTPMVMLMVYAGLQALPDSPFESAKVDGASHLQVFFKVTLPLVSPTILVAMLLRLIDAIKTFDIIYATTKGGPNFATENINILAYSTTFSYFEFGKSAAITVLFFIVVLGISGGFLQIKKRLEVEY